MLDNRRNILAESITRRFFRRDKRRSKGQSFTTLVVRESTPPYGPVVSEDTTRKFRTGIGQ